MKSSIVDTKQRLNEWVEDFVATNEKVCLAWKINIQNPGSDNEDSEKYATTQQFVQVNETDRILNLWHDIIDKDVSASKNLLDHRVVIV